MDQAAVLLPEFLLILLTGLLLVLSRLAPRMCPPAATFGLVAVLGAMLGLALTGAVSGPALGGAFQLGPFATVMRAAILLVATAASLLAWGEHVPSPARHWPLLIASSLGALGLAGSAQPLVGLASVLLMVAPLVGMALIGRTAAYEAWLLGGVTLAGAAGLARHLLLPFGAHAALWGPLAAGLGGLLLVAGAWLTLTKATPQRMLTGIAVTTTGLLLLALHAASQSAASGEALVAFVMTALCASAAIIGLTACLAAARAHSFADLASLSRRSPLVAWGLLACALGVAALPASGAFWARLVLVRAQLLYVSASLQFATLALAVLAMAAVLPAAYAALRLFQTLFSERLAPAPCEALELPPGHAALVMLAAAFSVATFAAPAALWALASFAASGF